MKLALLLPGYLDSPDYQHMLYFDQRLTELGYTVERLDPCQVWNTRETSNYTITHYLQQIQSVIAAYATQQPREILVIGHSLGGLVAIVAGARYAEITQVVALCPPPNLQGSTKKWPDQGSRLSRRELPNDAAQFRTFEVPYAFVEDGLQYSAQEAVKQLRQPVMILIAEDDQVVAPELTERIVANANQPYVVRMAGMGHDFRRSLAECEVVMSEIKKFIKKNTLG